MDFKDFNLDSRLMEGIQNAGYEKCTPVQEQVISASGDGSDLYVQSQTGTGKTAAYLIAVMQEILTKSECSGKKVLVLVPTRELAVQVEMECKTLCEKTGLVPFSFYGGVGYEKQVKAIEKGVDVLVATPGRIIDLQEQKKLDLSNVGFAIIDEADRMFDMGFYPDLRIILKHLPQAEQRQTMLFSATLNTYVKNLAWEYTRDAKEITIEAENITVDEIDQELIHVSSDEKTKLLIGILSREKPESTIIFCNTKKGCEILGKRLALNGFSSEYIIGDMQQSRRLKVLNDFKAGKVSILVATDVAARGIDVTDLAMVVNYDLPNEPENYVHRIGRTARAGKSGKAYTFCSEKDVYDLMPIERYIGKSIPSRVCNSEMTGKDKSEGIYIKLDSYGDDYNFDKRDSRRDSRRGGRSERRDGRSSDSRRNDRRSDRRNDNKKDSYKKERRDYAKEREELSNLSFEERMEVYKKKYADKKGSDNRKRFDGKKSNAKFSGKNSAYKNKKNYKADKNKVPSGKKVYDNNKKGVKKQGLFAKIKAFFGRK